MEAQRSTFSTLVLALGTFQASLLLLLLVLAVFLAGDLGETLDGLDTAAGLGLFGLLWGSSLFCTRQALRSLLPHLGYRLPLDRVLGAAVVWGGFTGALFTLVLLYSVFGYNLLTNSEGQESGLMSVISIALFVPFLPLGASAVAWLVGAAVGFIFGILYVILLLVSGSGPVANRREDAPA